jgi:sulfur transfer complex TusBCD TusB component (DsrH family)
VLQTGKAIEYLENGLSLGPFSDSTYSATTFLLEKGDRIVLATDGVVEAVDSSGGQFGMDRLKQVLESNHDLFQRTGLLARCSTAFPTDLSIRLGRGSRTTLPFSLPIPTGGREANQR